MVWRISYLMAISCWSSLASTVAVSIPCPVRKPCKVSWYWITVVSHRLIIPVLDFHRTSTRQIPMKSLPPPLVIRTTVYHVQASSRDTF